MAGLALETPGVPLALVVRVADEPVERAVRPLRDAPVAETDLAHAGSGDIPAVQLTEHRAERPAVDADVLEHLAHDLGLGLVDVADTPLLVTPVPVHLEA